MQDSIFVEKFEDIDFKNVKRNSKLSFYCKICNQLSEKRFYRLQVNRKLLCTKCLRAESIKNRTFEEKQKSIKKYKQSCLKHFGTEFPAQNKQIQIKIQQTCLEKYNSKCVVGSDYAEEKRKQTCQQKYGKEYYLQTNLAKEKIKESNLKKYNVESTNQLEEIKLKKRITFLKNYNVDNPFKSEEIKEKIKQMNLERYGVENYSQTNLARKNRRNQHFFDNQSFDSKPELCFYIYCKEQNLNIKRNTKAFEYFFEDKKHYYFPDFEIEGKFYEIKGEQFLNEKTNTWQNPFNHDQDHLYEVKHQCALKNGVKILYSKDCEMYIKYVEEKYGKDYIRNI